MAKCHIELNEFDKAQILIDEQLNELEGDSKNEFLALKNLLQKSVIFHFPLTPIDQRGPRWP